MITFDVMWGKRMCLIFSPMPGSAAQSREELWLQWGILAVCSTVVPDVWLKEGQRGKMSVWTVSPALLPVPLRGSNLDNLSSSFLISSAKDQVTAVGTNAAYTVDAYTPLIMYIRSSTYVSLFFYPAGMCYLLGSLNTQVWEAFGFEIHVKDPCSERWLTSAFLILS